MWEVPSHRIRAYVRARKEAKARISALYPAGDFSDRGAEKLHLRRVRAQLKISDGYGGLQHGIQGILPARVLLNDFGAKTLKLFTPTALRPGQVISISIEAPRQFYARAQVIACHSVPSETRIITEMPYGFRVAVAFLFDNDVEREIVRRYPASF
jgi:hypothetical protein